MDDIHNDVFDDLMMSQNKMATIVWGLLYREVLGELVICYDSIYKFKKELR